MRSGLFFDFGRMKGKKMAGRNVVIWSGGADSTYILDHYAGVSSEDYPVVALSVVEHTHLKREQVKIQNEAQARYLAHAKKKGYHIKHEKVSVRGNFQLFADVQNGMGQPLLWFVYLLSCVGENDTVHLGYIKGDSFWHNRTIFEDAFKALCRLKGLKAALSYPCEWDQKVNILEKLKKAKVPNDCWWSCDHPEDGKVCKGCEKCLAIKAGRKQMAGNIKMKNMQISESPKVKRRK